MHLDYYLNYIRHLSKWGVFLVIHLSHPICTNPALTNTSLYFSLKMNVFKECFFIVYYIRGILYLFFHILYYINSKMYIFFVNSFPKAWFSRDQKAFLSQKRG